LSATQQYLRGQRIKPEALRDDSAAAIQVAARQALFDYATAEGLNILRAKVQDLNIPEVTKTFSLPLVGDFSVRLYDVKVVQFNVSDDDSKLVILDGFFNLGAYKLETKVTFNWHWEKLGIQGTGDGELLLHGGNINYVFSVDSDAATQHPKLNVKLADSNFSSVELKIHSFSADWLYQAVLAIFNDAIAKAINRGIAGALSDDVPNAVNNVLSSLPTHLDITGLPFSTTFDYSIFTLTYVLIKGYGEFHAERTLAKQALAQAMQGLRSGASKCPYDSSPLPLGSDAIALDPHMLTLYVHDSLINCMTWGLHNSGALKYSIVDGTIPKLHLTTDLLVMLIPQLPKLYPHQPLRIDVEARSAPVVTFNASAGAHVVASYRTTIFVNNETLGVPHIVTMDANITITALVDWDSTVVTSVSASHVAVEAAPNITIPVIQWDRTVAWFVQNYAGLYPLHFLVDNFIHTPVTSMVGLINAKGSALERWFALASDIQVRDMPKAAAASAAAVASSKAGQQAVAW